MNDDYRKDQIPNIVVFSNDDIEKAKDYIASSLKTVIYPVDTIEELDKLFNEYLAMPKHSRFESDEACRRIFKCPNRDLYEIIKSHILSNVQKEKSDNKEIPSEINGRVSLPEQVLFAENKLNPLDYALLESYIPANFVEGIAKKEALIKKTFDVVNTDANCPQAEFPYMTSVEIIASKARFPDIPDGYFNHKGTIYSYYSEWFDGLQAAEHGIITEEYKQAVPYWIDEVRKTYYEYTNSNTNEDKLMNEYKLIELGWNPIMEFSAENRVKATNRFASCINCNDNVIDLSSDLLTEKQLIQPIIKSSLYPIYIILVEGKTVFSDITKKITRGPFSHAAISLDEYLDDMYSFNLVNGENKYGGLSNENIKNYPQDNKLGVFAIFVKQKDLHTIQNVLEYYKKNRHKTSYSILNILALPFNKAIKMDLNMICSEFVDNLLKLCNINITSKESPLVTPNDLYRATNVNKKIYKLYDGPVNTYDYKYIKSKVFRLYDKGEYIKETALLEVKEFPIQFSNEGDLLISNIGKIKYEDEYQKSHKLLLVYGKNSNVEGIKYELSKLWFINNLLEKDIYLNKDVINNSKCRSRVLNDFNTYLKLILKIEPEFNFTKYYNDTPFSNATMKIRSSTLKYSLEYLKKIISPMV